MYKKNNELNDLKFKTHERKTILYYNIQTRKTCVILYKFVCGGKGRKVRRKGGSRSEAHVMLVEVEPI